MAAVWGEAEIEVHVDGKALPGEMRRLTQAVGAEGAVAGDNFIKRFTARLTAGLRDSFGKFRGFFSGLWGRLFKRGGKTVGDSFTDGFKESMKTFTLEFDKVSKDVVRQTQDIAKAARDVDFGRWADDFGRFHQVFKEIDMGRLAIGPGMLDDIGELHQVFDDAGDSARRASGDFRILWRELEAGSGHVDKSNRNASLLNRAWTKLGASISGLVSRGGRGITGFFSSLASSIGDSNDAVSRGANLWKNLSHNTRQWTLIIGAVIAGLPDLAVLGSAAGSGLLVLGGALTAGVVGLLGMIAAFGPFVGDLKKLPPALKTSRKAFDQFGQSVSDLQDVLAVSVFEDSEDLWKSFGKTIKGLEGPVKTLGKSIRGVFDDLATAIAPGTKTFENLQGLIEKSGPIFRTLAGIIGTVGDALLTAFNNPQFQRSIQELLGWLDDLAQGFKTFVEGAGFEEWLANGRRVFGAFGRLLDTTSTLLNDLVTPEAVGRLVDFIDSLEGFLGGPGKDLLDFFGELDVFGLAAEALETFGKALEPLGQPMIDLAEGLNAVVNSGIDTLGPIIEDIATALAPFVQAIADFMKNDPKGVADALLLLAGGLTAMKAVDMAKMAANFMLFSDAVDVGGKNVRKFDVKKLGAIAATGALFAGLGVAIANSEGETKKGFEDLLGGAMSGAIAGMAFGPWGALIGTLIGAAIAANSSKPIQDFNDTVNRELGNFFRDIGQAFADGFESVMTAWNGFWGTDLPGSVTNLNETVNTAISDFFTGIGTTFTTAFEGLTILWTSFWATLGDPEFWFSIADSIGQWIADLILGFASFVIEAATTWSLFWANLPSYMEGAITAIAEGIATWWTGIVEDFKKGINDAVTNWNNFWANLPGFVQAAVAAIGGIISGWWTSLGAAFTSGVSNLQTRWTTFWANLPATLGAIIVGIVDSIVGLWTRITAAFQNGFAAATAAWNSFWNGLTGVVSRVVSTILGFVNRLVAPIQNAIGSVGKLLGLSGGGSGGGGAAAGAVLMGPRRILAGEAGPEAIVPLNRPLSMVNPSVRALSAFAQGMAPPGGTQGVASRILNVNEGAIQIVGSPDPARTSLAVVNRLIERAV